MRCDKAQMRLSVRAAIPTTTTETFASLGYHPRGSGNSRSDIATAPPKPNAGAAPLAAMTNAYPSHTNSEENRKGRAQRKLAFARMLASPDNANEHGQKHRPALPTASRDPKSVSP